MNNNNLQVFINKDFGKIRTIMKDNEVWFVGKDVANALRYSNPLKAIRDHVDNDDKGMNETFTPAGGKQQTIFINESGLYSLVLSSKLLTAKQFKRWITKDVLPSIRTTGSYVMPKYKLPTNYKEAVQALLEEIEKHEQTQKELEEAKPKAEFADTIAKAKTNLPIGAFAKIVYSRTGMGRNKLFEWLRHNEYLMSIPSEYNKPTQKAINLGILTSSERISKDNLLINVSVTPKGQLYIYRKLANYKENHSLLLGNKAKMIMA